MAPAEDCSVGFTRAEMGTERLAGSANAAVGRHIFLVWGKAAEWPEKVPDECPEGSLPKLLQAALERVKKVLAVKTKLNLLEAGGDDKEGDVLVFPDYLRFNITSGTPGSAGLEGLLAFLCGKWSRGNDIDDLKGLPAFLSTKGSQGSDIEELKGSFAFFCGHAKRDARCAYCGPRLAEAAEAERRRGQHSNLQVRQCSHVGQHKYAGNAILFSGPGTQDDGHWYGYVTPENLPDVLAGRATRSRLWRGRLGLDEAAAIRERRVQALWEHLPLLFALGTATAIVGSIAYFWRRRPEPCASRA